MTGMSLWIRYKRHPYDSSKVAWEISSCILFLLMSANYLKSIDLKTFARNDAGNDALIDFVSVKYLRGTVICFQYTSAIDVLLVRRRIRNKRNQLLIYDGIRNTSACAPPPRPSRP